MKYFKFITASLLCIFGLVFLSGCSSKNSFYKEWTDAGVTMEKENCFVEVTLDEAKEKIDANDTFVLMIVKPSNSSCVGAVQKVYNTSVYYEADEKVYILNVEKYTKLSERTKVEEALGINSMSKVESGAIYVVYNHGVDNSGKPMIDSSSTKTTKFEAFLDETNKIKPEALFAYLFNDFSFE